MSALGYLLSSKQTAPVAGRGLSGNQSHSDCIESMRNSSVSRAALITNDCCGSGIMRVTRSKLAADLDQGAWSASSFYFASWEGP